MRTSETRRRTPVALLTVISGLTISVLSNAPAHAQEIDYGNFRKHLPGSMWYEFIDVTAEGVPRGFIYAFAAEGSFQPAVPNLFSGGLNPYTGVRILLVGNEMTEVSVLTYSPVGSDFGLTIQQSWETIIWDKQSYAWESGYLIFVDWSQVPFGTPWNQQEQYAVRHTWFSLNSTFFRQYIFPWHFPTT